MKVFCERAITLRHAQIQGGVVLGDRNFDRWMLNPYVVRRKTEEGLELWNLQTGQRIEVSPEAWKILSQFDGKLEQGITAIEKYDNLVEQAVEKGLLVEIGYKNPTEYPRGLFNLPSMDFYTFHNVYKSAEVVFLGVPYDGGSLTSPGARFGPGMLRMYSWSIDWQVDKERRIRGFYDLDEQKDLFSDVRIWDLGNIGNQHSLHLVSRGECLSTVTHTLQFVLDTGAVPVLIGGDHSITAGAVAAMERYKRIGIIQLDAHSDYMGPITDPQTVFHNNFVGYLVTMSHVEVICQLGLRNPHCSESHPKIRAYTLRQTMERLPKIVEKLPRDIPYYVTVDVDVLDPVYLPNTGCYVPGGMCDSELVGVLQYLGQNLFVIGADFVELTHEPLYDHRVGVMLSNIVLRFIASILDNRSSKNTFCKEGD